MGLNLVRSSTSLHALRLFALLLGISWSSGPFTRAQAAEVASAVPALPAYDFHEGEARVIYDNLCFVKILEMVKRAQKSIRFEFYIFGGPMAELVIDAMIEKHRAGVDVRVLLDKKLGSVPTNWKETKPALKRLQDAGIPVLFATTQAIFPGSERSTLDHNKLVVIDDTVEGVVGSTNFSTLFLSYHDLVVHFTGGTVAELAQQFDHDWALALGAAGKKTPPMTLIEPNLRAPKFTGEIPADPALSQIRLLSTGIGRSNIFPVLLRAIQNARKSIDVGVHEFGDERLVRALIAAHQRGVKVRIMLDPWAAIDKFLMGMKLPKSIPNAGTLKLFIEAGLAPRLYKTTDSLVAAHMKMMIVDGETLHAGSANWTEGAWEHVAETNLEIHGGQAVRDAQAQYDSDWATQSELAPKPTRAQMILHAAFKKGSQLF